MLETITALAHQGIPARVDGEGRVCLPRSLRDRLGLTEHSQVLCNGTTELIILSKYIPTGDLEAHISSLDVQLKKMSCDSNVPSGMVIELARLTAQMLEVIKKFQSSSD